MRAYARSTDPETSWEAADSVSDSLRSTQKAVLRVLREEGPMTDTTLVEVYQERADGPQQADSGIRTRRKELVERGLVRWTGNFERLESGRRSRVWEATKRRMLKRYPDEEIS